MRKIELAKITSIRKFLEKCSVDKKSCWLWTGQLDQEGYGKVTFVRQGTSTHRLSFRIFRGEVPKGFQLDHLCRVRNCFNPFHLEIVTALENVRRAIDFKKTHCKRGHKFNVKNTYIAPNGQRLCKRCHKILRDSR